MDTVKNAANYVTETIKEASSSVSKEANKDVAKDSNASVGDRATAAKDAALDKKDETIHNAKGEGYKDAAKK